MLPNQIACLECDLQRLFVEIIQVIEPRQLYWARPLALVSFSTSSPWIQATSDPVPHVQPLSGEPDIVWPMGDFRVALDSEVVPLLPYFTYSSGGPPPGAAATSVMQQFMERLWLEQAQPNQPD